MTTLDDMLNELAPEDRAHVEARSKELIMEERALQTLRKAKRLSQTRMAELLNMRQDSVSRLERRSDLLISTLRSYIEAMGGSLKLMVNFPGQPSLFLDSLDMKAVKTVHKPVVVDGLSVATPSFHKCLSEHVARYPIHVANLNVDSTAAARACFTPACDTVLVVGYQASEHVHCMGDRGFSVKATLGTPSMTYASLARDESRCRQHETA